MWLLAGQAGPAAPSNLAEALLHPTAEAQGRTVAPEGTAHTGRLHAKCPSQSNCLGVEAPCFFFHWI